MFDFSSAFNTIQPLLLRDKLQMIIVDSPTVSWVTDYLSDRMQFVRLSAALSDIVDSDIGASQGPVMAPFLFTLYISHFQHNSGGEEDTEKTAIESG